MTRPIESDLREAIEKELQRLGCVAAKPVVGNCFFCGQTVQEDSDYVDLVDDDGENNGEIACRRCS